MEKLLLGLGSGGNFHASAVVLEQVGGHNIHYFFSSEIYPLPLVVSTF